jgi:glycerophosphoryl diester phosphodiesterase family protein
MSGPQIWTTPDSPLPHSSDHPLTPGRPSPGTPDLPGEQGEDGAPSEFSPTDGQSDPGGHGTERVELLGGDIAFRPLGISEILDGSIAVIRRHPRAVLGLSVAITTIIQVLNSLGAYFLIGDQARDELTPEPLTRSVGAQFTLGLIGLIMSAYGTLLLAGLLAPVLSRTLFDRPASLGQAWREARPQLARLVGTAAAVLLGSLLVLVVAVLPFVLTLAADGPAGLGVLTGLLGIPLGLTAMVWLYVLWVLAVPAVVLERQTVFGALRRAYRLSRRRWWRTFGTLLLATLITIFMGFVALRLPFLVAQLIFFGEAPSGAGLVGSLAIDTLGRIVSWSLIAPFDAGVIALLYIDRRMRREGFDLDVRTRLPAASSPDGSPDDPLSIWRPVDYPRYQQQHAPTAPYGGYPLTPPYGTPPYPAPQPTPQQDWTPRQGTYSAKAPSHGDGTGQEPRGGRNEGPRDEDDGVSGRGV